MIGATATQPPVRILNPGGPVPRGVENFAEAVTGRYCLVDKSPFIRQILDCDDKVMLITRPRRFGKTINMSMLQAFFERPREGDKTADLFNGMLIQQAPDGIIEQKRQYPVISLSFKDVKETCWQDAREHLCQLLRDEVSRQWPAEMDEACLRGLLPSQQEALRHVVDGEASDLQWRNSLWALCAGLTRQYGRPPLVLLDEYDTPLHAAYAHTKPEELEDGGCYFNRMVQFMRGLLGTALKGKDTAFHKAVITGILRVAKENIFSGLNNPGVYGVTEERFASSFGFTEAEVADLLAARGLRDRFDAVRDWYNGYRFGGDTPATIYNPWSVISYATNPTQIPRPYWVNTSGNELVHSMLEKSNDPQDRADMETLLLGGAVEKEISDSLALRDLPNLSDALWSILLTSGYLTVDHGETPLFGTRLRVPNKEVQFVYRRLVTGWFHKSAASHVLPAALKALAAGNVEQFARHLTTFAGSSLSYFDFAGPEPERVYHALVLGMLAYLSDAYRIRSNRESGRGRSDLVLIPNDPKRRGIVMEFKVVRTEDQLKQAAQAALQQIKDKNYAAEFAQRQCSFVLAVGIAFAGKSLAAAHERLG
ncbi:MAG: AAA family ATPase [Myxococcota bacterium]